MNDDNHPFQHGSSQARRHPRGGPWAFPVAAMPAASSASGGEPGEAVFYASAQAFHQTAAQRARGAFTPSLRFQNTEPFPEPAEIEDSAAIRQPSMAWTAMITLGGLLGLAVVAASLIWRQRPAPVAPTPGPAVLATQPSAPDAAPGALMLLPEAAGTAAVASAAAAASLPAAAISPPADGGCLPARAALGLCADPSR